MPVTPNTPTNSGNSVTHQRRTIFYPEPKSYALLMGYMARNEMGVSETLNMILKDFFANKTPEERVILLRYYQEKQKEKEKGGK
jgi:hypothetical protein